MNCVKRIKVDLGRRSYEILIGPGLLADSGEILRGLGLKGKILVVTNPKVGGLYLSSLWESLVAAGFEVESVTIPDGEEYKSLPQMERVYEAAVRMRLERSSTILALGGGVIGDLAGFAAATYLRGINFVQAPTTLLAQVDSSVGGKVAVNHRDGKNLIGAFYQPRVVIADLETLHTLEERDFISGMAEIIKAGLIKDPHLCRVLAEKDGAIKAQDQATLGQVIAAACSIKAEVVEADELEGGIREILNYGHTIGHALEAETGYQVYRHGEAVAIGMHGAARLAVLMGICRPELLEFTLDLLEKYRLPTRISGLSKERLIERMFWDKKISGGELRLVLPVAPGRVETVVAPPLELLKRALVLLGANGGEA
ncbi:MAG TPA: 3-dehydroquinate synthase [Bacillota bacterium]